MNAEVEKKIKERGAIKGGTKEACIIIEDVLYRSSSWGTILDLYTTGVSVDEFIGAIQVLIAFANKNTDTEIESVSCNSDCAYNCITQCPAQRKNLLICKNAKKMCPYYEVEDK